jgi:hypothetical protein
MLKFVKASTKRKNKIESAPVLRILASGLKLTQLLVAKMNVIIPVKGEDNENRSYIHYAEAGGELYLYVTDETVKEGGIVGDNQCFNNTSLKTELLKLAGLPVDYETSEAEIVSFDVDTNGIESEGTTYFKVTPKGGAESEAEADAEGEFDEDED